MSYVHAPKTGEILQWNVARSSGYSMERFFDDRGRFYGHASGPAPATGTPIWVALPQSSGIYTSRNAVNFPDVGLPVSAISSAGIAVSIVIIEYLDWRGSGAMITAASAVVKIKIAQ